MAREISEHDATLAIDAAARELFAQQRKMTLDILPPGASDRLSDWDGIGPVQQLQWRQNVLLVVRAALGALPDQRRAAWAEGYMAGSSDGAFEASGSGRIEGLVYPHINPYPATAGAAPDRNEDNA